jgi:hypothetical protein
MSPVDATFMNENCPVEASNLNNPSQLFQEVSGLCLTVPCNTHKIFYLMTYLKQLKLNGKLPTRECMTLA